MSKARVRKKLEKRRRNNFHGGEFPFVRPAGIYDGLKGEFRSIESSPDISNNVERILANLTLTSALRDCTTEEILMLAAIAPEFVKTMRGVLRPKKEPDGIPS